MSVTIRTGCCCFLMMLALAVAPASAQTGKVGGPVRQSVTVASQPLNLLGPGSIEIIPQSPTEISNCIPFGNNTDFSFTGFIYRDVPPFNLAPGLKIAFDLGDLNDVDIRRNIYLAVANKNPTLSTCGFNVGSQGVAALGWTRVVSDSQIPENPQGNTVVGDYELVYTSEAAFAFPGGGLIVGFGGSPPGAYADGNCEQVLNVTDCFDSSGNFYARFCLKDDQTLDVLDEPGSCGGTGLELGGIVIQSRIVVAIDIKPGSYPNSINPKSKGMIPVAILTTDTFDATTVDPLSVKFGPDGATEAHRRGHRQDVNGDGKKDLMLHFRTQDTGIVCGDTSASLTGETFSGQAIEGSDSIRTVGCK